MICRPQPCNAICNITNPSTLLSHVITVIMSVIIMIIMVIIVKIVIISSTMINISFIPS